MDELTFVIALEASGTVTSAAEQPESDAPETEEVEQ